MGCMFGLMLFGCSLEIHFALGPANYLASPGWDEQFHIDLDLILLDSLLLQAYNLTSVLGFSKTAGTSGYVQLVGGHG